MRNRRALALVLVISGCNEAPYPEGSCRFTTDLRSARPLDDAAQLGFSGADLIAAVNARRPGALTWHDGATTSITVQATPTSDTAMVYAPPPNEGYCSPNIDVDADL